MMIVKKITKEKATTSGYAEGLIHVIKHIFNESGVKFAEKERKGTAKRPIDSLAYLSSDLSIYLFKMESIDRVVFEVHFSSAYKHIIEKHVLAASAYFYTNAEAMAEVDFINKTINIISIIAFDFTLTPDDKLIALIEPMVLKGNHLDVALLCCLLLENNDLYNHHLQKTLLKRLHSEKNPETVAVLESVLIE